MECKVCGSKNLLARVELSYDVPLAARAGGITVGKLQVSRLDVRAAWEKLEERPIYCHDCGAPHAWVVRTKSLEARNENAA